MSGCLDVWISRRLNIYSSLCLTRSGDIMVYVALLYEGVGQRLVRYEASNETDFFAKLNARFGCYVCLWFTEELIANNEKVHTQNPC